jgi:hypothetical protein
MGYTISCNSLLRHYLNTKVDSAVRQKAIELQSDIISLQSGLLNLQIEHQESLRERDSLKQQLMKAKNWKNEARKYSLKEIASGVFVYAIKQDKQGTQPMHWLCTNCYENTKKSILQKGKRTPQGTVYYCSNPECKAEIIDHSNSLSVSPFAGRKRTSYEVR